MVPSSDYLSLLGLVGSSFAIAFSGALMPGPLLVATVDLSARFGARSGPLLVLGHGLLEAALVGGLAAGLAPLLTSEPLLAAVGLLGAAMLWWMAAGMLRAESLETMNGNGFAGRLHPVWAGVVLSVVNPYWALWWATIGLGYIVASQRFGVLGLAAFFLSHISADLLWYGVVAAAVARGKSLLTPRRFRGLAVACAALLILSGGFFAYTGVRYLL
jgi:threonine/homoserine/homoserine lactone efflux protein